MPNFLSELIFPVCAGKMRLKQLGKMNVRQKSVFSGYIGEMMPKIELPEERKREIPKKK